PAILVTNLQHLLLQVFLAASRRTLRTPRPIMQFARAARSIATQPLVTGLATDAVLAAARRQGLFEHQHFLDEIHAHLRHRAHFPWHGSAPPEDRFHANVSATYVFARLSPMCLPHTASAASAALG